eukprot:2443371-Ditylum_brightwellii.AAC.1
MQRSFYRNFVHTLGPVLAEGTPLANASGPPCELTTRIEVGRWQVFAATHNHKAAIARMQRRRLTLQP